MRLRRLCFAIFAFLFFFSEPMSTIYEPNLVNDLVKRILDYPLHPML